jgi:hypothetical protein
MASFRVIRGVLLMNGLGWLVAGLILGGALTSNWAGAATKGSRSRVEYYLTKTTHTGGTSLTACSEGFHMASLWEIFDTSNLLYRGDLGATQEDSGSGPPRIGGWIRTGGEAAAVVSPPVGAANCNGYTSDGFGPESGTVAGLGTNWADPTLVRPISPWFAFAQTCLTPLRVWCVQD